MPGGYTAQGITSDTWADQLGFAPWVRLTDGCYANRAFLEALGKPVNNAGRDDPHGHRFSAPVDPLSHETANATGGQHDHG